jgi:phosphoribosylanthranilate isomerase
MTRIKICGVTTLADALLAAELGADAVGLNFYTPSPRFVAPDVVRDIVRELPPFVDTVGVFVNQGWRDVHYTAKKFHLRNVQLHGEHRETGYDFPLRRIDAFPVRDARSLDAIVEYLETARERSQPPAAILVDGYRAGEYGGTGRTAPWQLLADFRPGVPVILAGGLTPDNVAEAVRLVRPYAVDVAGGVEMAPGRKDPEKMRRFIVNARTAAAGP